MSPIDYRNATFNDIRRRLTASRRCVLSALRRHGPATTRQLAAAMEWDILSVRPRITELCQLGYVECLAAKSHEGRYRARSEEETLEEFHRRKHPFLTTQLTLTL